MNILQQQDLLKNLPDQTLQKELVQPTGGMPSFLVLTELNRRKDMRQAYQAQQKQPGTSMADEFAKGMGSADVGNYAGAVRDSMPSSSSMGDQAPQNAPQGPSQPTGQPVTGDMAGGGGQQMATPQSPQGFAGGGGVFANGGGVDFAKIADPMALMGYDDTPYMKGYKNDDGSINMDFLAPGAGLIQGQTFGDAMKGWGNAVIGPAGQMFGIHLAGGGGVPSSNNMGFNLPFDFSHPGQGMSQPQGIGGATTQGGVPQAQYFQTHPTFGPTGLLNRQNPEGPGAAEILPPPIAAAPQGLGALMLAASGGGSANGATGSGGDSTGGVSGTGGVGGSNSDGAGGSAAAGPGADSSGNDAGDGGGTYARGGPIRFDGGGDVLRKLQQQYLGQSTGTPVLPVSLDQNPSDDPGTPATRMVRQALAQREALRAQMNASNPTPDSRTMKQRFDDAMAVPSSDIGVAAVAPPIIDAIKGVQSGVDSIPRGDFESSYNNQNTQALGRFQRNMQGLGGFLTPEPGYTLGESMSRKVRGIDQSAPNNPAETGGTPEGPGNPRFAVPDYMPRAKAAISGMESGDNYGALGPMVGTDRAYGKYQMMGANIPAWTKQYLGSSMMPEEFLKNPDAQEKVFEGEFGRLADKYGPYGAAKAWFSGEGGMKNPFATDNLGTSVAGYGKGFADRFDAGGMNSAGVGAIPPEGLEATDADGSPVRMGGGAGGAGGAGGRGGIGSAVNIGGQGLEDYIKQAQGLMPPDGYDAIIAANKADRDKLDKGAETDKGLALLSAGLGIAAGTSPYFATNVGKGAQEGIKSWNESSKEMRQAQRDIRNSENAVTIARANRDERGVEKGMQLYANAQTKALQIQEMQQRDAERRDRYAETAADRRARTSDTAEDRRLRREALEQDKGERAADRKATNDLREQNSVITEMNTHDAAIKAGTLALANPMIDDNSRAEIQRQLREHQTHLNNATNRLRSLRGETDAKKGRDTQSGPPGNVIGTYNPATGKIE